MAGLLVCAGVPRPAAGDTGTAGDGVAAGGPAEVVEFWASWCAGCRESLSYLADVATRFGPRGVRVRAVNLDEDRSAGALLEPLLGDGIVKEHDPEGKTASRFGVESLPATFVVRPGRAPVLVPLDGSAGSKAGFEALVGGGGGAR